MASLPQKSTSGNNLKQWLIRSIDGLIDYLSATRVRPGYGISVEETPSGTVISLKNRPAGVPQQMQQQTGGGASGIDAAVSGGTASISLTGGTGSVNMVGSGSVSISENGAGEIVFTGSGSGGTYPYQPIDGPIMNEDTDYYFSQDTWISGLLETLSAGSGKLGYGYIDLNIGVKTRRIFYSSGAIDLSIPFSILIHAGTTVRLICEGDASAVLYYQYD